MSDEVQIMTQSEEFQPTLLHQTGEPDSDTNWLAFQPAGTINDPSSWYLVLKRFVDIVLSLVVFVIFLGAFVMVGILIVTEDGFPILFSLEAVGVHGRRFRVYKFRSMRRDADSYLEAHPEHWEEYLREMKLKNDPRLTRIGRFIRQTSIDEIPQVLNVIRGEMSFVGPRYIRPEELDRYGAFATLRSSMLPGITGLWQVSGRNDIPYQQRVIFDRTYYYTRSFITDAAIILRTIPVLLLRQGAY